MGQLKIRFSEQIDTPVTPTTNPGVFRPMRATSVEKRTPPLLKTINYRWNLFRSAGLQNMGDAGMLNWQTVVIYSLLRHTPYAHFQAFDRWWEGRDPSPRPYFHLWKSLDLSAFGWHGHNLRAHFWKTATPLRFDIFARWQFFCLNIIGMLVWSCFHSCASFQALF